MFHATGTGGRAMEALVESGFLAGVLDVTTTELARRPRGRRAHRRARTGSLAAGRAGIPQVVSLGALDMVNFGARDTVPPQFERPHLYVHNPSVTLMRTTPEECAELGRADRAQARRRPPARPRSSCRSRGVSLIDAAGQPFHDPEADAALFEALRDRRRPTSR